MAAVLLHVTPEALQPHEAAAAFDALRLASLGLVLLHMRQALDHAREDALAVVTLVELFLKVRGLQVHLKALLRLKAGLAHLAADGHSLGMGAQVNTVVAQLAELLSALGAAVGTHARVQVHVLAKEESIGEGLITHIAMVLSSHIWCKKLAVIFIVSVLFFLFFLFRNLTVIALILGVVHLTMMDISITLGRSPILLGHNLLGSGLAVRTGLFGSIANNNGFLFITNPFAISIFFFPQSQCFFCENNIL